MLNEETNTLINAKSPYLCGRQDLELYSTIVSISLLTHLILVKSYLAIFNQDKWCDVGFQVEMEHCEYIFYNRVN